MDIKVERLGYNCPVELNAEGVPYCPRGCGHLMTEVAPGEYQCPDGLAINNFLRDAVQRLERSL